MSRTRKLFENEVGRDARSRSRACASPNMFEAALDGSFKGMYIQGEDFVQSDPEHAITSPPRWKRWNAWWCRTSS